MSHWGEAFIQTQKKKNKKTHELIKIKELFAGDESLRGTQKRPYDRMEVVIYDGDVP